MLMNSFYIYLYISDICLSKFTIKMYNLLLMECQLHVSVNKYILWIRDLFKWLKYLSHYTIWFYLMKSISEPEDVGGVYYIVTYSYLLVLTREDHSSLKGPVTCTWQLIRIHIYKLHVNISTYLDLGGDFNIRGFEISAVAFQF